MRYDGNMITELEQIPGVGQVKKRQLERIGVYEPKDLLLLKPRRYEDFSKIMPVHSVRPGNVTVRAQVTSLKSRYVRRGLHILTATLSDDSGSLSAIWFNQPYLEKTLQTGKWYFFSGEFAFQRSSYGLQNPAFEPVGKEGLKTGRILAVYPETKGLTSRQIRGYVDYALQSLEPPRLLPAELEKRYALPRADQALLRLHQPESQAQIELSQRYLSLFELTAVLTAAYKVKREFKEQTARPVPFDKSLMQKFVSGLAFELTDDQRKVMWRITQDMEAAQPMNRLVQGDVGSGKTVVAAAAVLQTVRAGYQAAFMAPTELLAKQHAESLAKLLRPFKVKTALLTSATSGAERQKLLDQAAKGQIDLLIGTHALIQEHVSFKDLQLAVIDEQHRFGVKQRHQLQSKSQVLPHLLSLSATPIPRTLALTVYAELNISVIKQMPKGRRPIETKLVSPNSREQLYAKMREQLESGHQIYVVYPLIEESESLPALDATQGSRDLQQKFKNFKVELLHGRMKPEEKDSIMRHFVAGGIDILVATSVIEVGVDVPNATVMVLESAERFGLAQAHQLRGRVGRSEYQSYCFLIPSHSRMVSRRLRELARTTDGFKLAELDLELRGPGSLYGTAQHGALDLSYADLRDSEQIAMAQEGAEYILDKELNLVQYKQFAAAVKSYSTLTQLN